MSIPKTIYFNFRYLNLKVAIKLPIFLACNVRIREMKGKIKIDSPVNFAMIRIGYFRVPILDEYSSHTILDVHKSGILHFKGDAHIGQGSKIVIWENGHLILGKNFAISSSTQIICYHRIIFGDNIQFSWDCLVMDSDGHPIKNIDGDRINENRPIIFGNKIWIGCRTVILKGSIISDNSVIAASSVVTGKHDISNAILAGNPARIIRKIGGWDI